MSEIGSYEAKTHLPALLDRVERGESITITRHGHPVAQLVPVSKPGRREFAQIIREMNELRKGNRLGDLTVKQLIEEGRRY
jgi:prevent-host-death family protein